MSKDFIYKMVNHKVSQNANNITFPQYIFLHVVRDISGNVSFDCMCDVCVCKLFLFGRTEGSNLISSYNIKYVL